LFSVFRPDASKQDGIDVATHFPKHQRHLLVGAGSGAVFAVLNDGRHPRKQGGFVNDGGCLRHRRGTGPDGAAFMAGIHDFFRGRFMLRGDGLPSFQVFFKPA
jgi:hypothetical protein